MISSPNCHVNNYQTTHQSNYPPEPTSWVINNLCFNQRLCGTQKKHLLLSLMQVINLDPVSASWHVRPNTSINPCRIEVIFRKHGNIYRVSTISNNIKTQQKRKVWAQFWYVLSMFVSIFKTLHRSYTDIQLITYMFKNNIVIIFGDNDINMTHFLFWRIL